MLGNNRNQHLQPRTAIVSVVGNCHTRCGKTYFVTKEHQQAKGDSIINIPRSKEPLEKKKRFIGDLKAAISNMFEKDFIQEVVKAAVNELASAGIEDREEAIAPFLADC